MASENIPLLDQVQVAAPCHMNWDEMIGGERVRYCRACERNVYNLSEMTQAEAEKLLHVHEEGRLCVRYYRRNDGKMMTKNCPVGVKALRWAYLRQTTALASLCSVFFGAMFLFASRSEPNEPTPIQWEPHEPVLGSLAIDPERGNHTAVIMAPLHPPIMGTPILTPQHQTPDAEEPSEVEETPRTSGETSDASDELTASPNQEDAIGPVEPEKESTNAPQATNFDD